MKKDEMPAIVISQFQLGKVTLPNGNEAIDLFVSGQSRRDGPTQTIRLRLPPNVLHAVVQSLTEAAGAKPAGQVQRLFDQASLTPVQLDASGLLGYLLTMQQKNPSQGRELPVEMFVEGTQLAGLAELLNQALATPHPATIDDSDGRQRH